MKKYINILTLVFSSLLLFSCESEERMINGQGEQGELKFILSPQTRSTQTGAFDVGDDIGVFAVERTNDSQVGSLTNPKYVNALYRFNGTSFDPVGTKIQYSGKKYDFYAYSPYNASYTNINQIVHTASTNQVDGSGWLDADLCSAINTTGIATGNVPLSFDHKFATVQLIVDNDVNAVSLLQVQTTGTFDFATNTATAQGSKSDIGMYKKSAGMFLATFPVQTLSGTVFKITKSNNKTVDFKLASNKGLQEGVNVIYSISLKKTITVNDPDNGSATGGGEYEVGEECTVTATPDEDYAFEGWYEDGIKVSPDPEYTFTVSEDRDLTPVFKSTLVVETWEYTFSISSGNISSGYSAGSGSVVITSNKKQYHDGVFTGTTLNVGYTLSSKASWISAGNNSPNLSWTENTSTSPRTGNVNWQQDESGKTVNAKVTQTGKNVVTTDISYEISINPTSHTFAASGGSKAFSVTVTRVTKTYTDGVLTNTATSNVPSGWSVSVIGTGFSNSGTTVTASANPTTYSRNGLITVSYEGESAQASLYQEGKPSDVITTETSYTISVNPTSHTFAATGGSKTFTVTVTKIVKTFTNGTLTNTATTPVSSGWSTSVTGTGFSRSGDTVTASVNNSTSSRSGTFTATYSGVSASASLYQEGKEEGEIIITE